MVGSRELDTYPLSGQTRLASHPDGQFIKYPGSSTVYRLEDGQKHPISSWTLFVAFAESKDILTVPPSFSYPDGSSLAFSDGLLIRSFSDPTVYLIENGQRHAISSPAVLARLGYSFAQVAQVSESDILLNERGGDIVQ